jgi:hypothetical protein
VVVVTAGSGRAGSVVLVVARVVIGGAAGEAVVVVLAMVGSVVVVLAMGGSGTGEVKVVGDDTVSPEGDALVSWRPHAASKIRRTMTAQEMDGPPDFPVERAVFPDHEDRVTPRGCRP